MPTALLAVVALLALAVPASAAAPPLASSFPPFAAAGCVQARSAAAIGTSRISIGAETMDRAYTRFESWQSYLGPLGATRARIQGGWARTEQTAGVYNDTWLREIVGGMLDVGVQPWLQFSYGNPVYPDGGDASADSPLPTGAALTAFLHWVNYTLTSPAYARINAFEVWNEPDIRNHATPEDYGHFFVTVAKTVRVLRPTAEVYLQIAGDVEYLATAMRTVDAAGALDLVSAVTYHPYTYNPSSTYGGKLEALQTAALGRPLFQGENGAPSVGGGYGALGGYAWSETSQAKWALRRLLGDVARNLTSSLFSIADMCYLRNGQLDVNHKGLLEVNCSDVRLPVLRAKQGYTSVQALTSTFDSSVAALPLTTHTWINGSTASAAATQRLVFRSSKGSCMLVFWDASGTPANATLDEHCQAAAAGTCSRRLVVDAACGRVDEPVLVDLRLGAAYALPSSAWNRTSACPSPSGACWEFFGMPIYDSPLLLADRSALHLGSCTKSADQ